MTGRSEELVLGVPRSLVMGEPGWRGVRSEGVESVLESVALRGAYRARREVEDDPSWKQVIPYLVLRDGRRIFLMRRTRAGGDARLHERHTIGIGGHVNPEDGDLMGGLRREWREELEADFEPDFRLLGLLNDDEDPVGEVHLGVVFAADAEGRAVAIREREKLEGWFAEPEAIAAVRDRLESWSALLFDFLESRREAATPTGERR